MIERRCPCKVNLILEILRKRADGFHELETILHPVAYEDILQVEEQREGIALSCTDPTLPVDRNNLVHRAAEKFLTEARIRQGARIHLDKRIPLAAGLGGGSSDAAHTLQALNELFGRPVPPNRIEALARELGSDVPFFLQSAPALATGRGEEIVPLPFFPALRGTHLLLVYPGFGVSTAWAYSHLELAAGSGEDRRGRAGKLAELLRSSDLAAAASCFANSLEKPVLRKYPLLDLYQAFLRETGALVTLMSGSGSTTFALFTDAESCAEAAARFPGKFGEQAWVRRLPMVNDGAQAG